MVSLSLIIIFTGLIAGIFLTLHSIPWQIIYILFAIPFIFILKNRRILFFSLGIITGYITTYIHIQVPSHHILNYKCNCIDKAEGMIISSRTYPFSTEYVVDMDVIEMSGIQYRVSGRILLKVKDIKHFYYLPGSYLSMNNLVLQQIPLPLNPGGFDYSRYLQRKGIYLEGKADNIFVKEKRNFLLSLYKIRLAIIKKIDSVFLYFPEEKELLKTITIGSEHIPEFLREAGIKSGTYHLLVISGLHIVFILLFLKIIFIPFAEVNNRHPKLFPSLALFFLWFYACLTGFKVPVLRAVLMVSLFFLGELIERDIDIISSIIAAAFFLLVINPYNIYDVSFHLSFLATLGIVLFWKRFKLTERNYLKSIILTSLSAQISVIPILLYHFGYFYPAGLINNIFFVPLAGIILIISFVSFIIPLFFYILRFLLTFFIRGITLSASISPPVVISFSIPLIITFYIFFLLLLYSPRKKEITAGLISIIFISLTLNLLHKGKQEKGVIYFLSLTRPSVVYLEGNDSVCFLADHYKTSELEETVIPLLKKYNVDNITLFYTTSSFNHTATFNTLKKQFNIKVYEPEGIKKAFAYPYLKIYYYNTYPYLFKFLSEGEDISLREFEVEFIGEENGMLTYVIKEKGNAILIAPYVGEYIAEKIRGENIKVAYFEDVKKTKGVMKKLSSVRYDYLILPQQYKKFDRLLALRNNSFYLNQSAVKIIFNNRSISTNYYYQKIILP
ncbi:MAG: ComEC family competence protein [bacterium]|nr:ComEC family competence protein [bacterium]